MGQSVELRLQMVSGRFEDDTDWHVSKGYSQTSNMWPMLSFLRIKLSKFESLGQNSANAPFTGELAPFNLGLLLRFPFADDSGGSSTETWKKSSARNHLRVDEAGCSRKSGGRIGSLCC
ncbi:hypothetical protein TNCT_606031 [Trichonephila clavata]|uniref:Uncharacterized protein n=1 Tax=Trichonephila clavata TaxID=2740835 RepID=A0A8X6LDM1_TRICU|nr:hypothetical protein TNCT_606031 [Trichonephila clavata]